VVDVESGRGQAAASTLMKRWRVFRKSKSVIADLKFAAFKFFQNLISPDS
jgi:hypothetical protein